MTMDGMQKMSMLVTPQDSDLASDSTELADKAKKKIKIKTS